MDSKAADKKPGFLEALRLWFKIGCIGFGGPSGQIAILHSEVVEKRGWITEVEFVRTLQFCMLLPGPEAQQLATWIGWRLHGIRGGLAAGTLFLLPAALLLWLLSLLYMLGREVPLLHGFFDGLKPAVVAIVLSALWRIGRKTITSRWLGIIALAAFFLFCFHASYPLVVIGFGLVGCFLFPKIHDAPSVQPTGTIPGNWLASLRMALLLVCIWAFPIAGLFFWLGSKALPVQVGLFFAKVAVFSFGGAYAALSYVSLHAVHDWGWITSGQMMDGLGLAETTPGPLLIALQFVAFMACYQAPGMLPPLISATLGSLVAIWSLFLPSFLWIFSLAPHMERISQNRRMSGALAAIGAVVTAVIAYLAFWFAGSLFFPERVSQGLSHGIQGIPMFLAWVPLILSLLAFALLQLKRIGIVPLILLFGVIGIAMKFSGYS